jgi:hypothetical protein
MRGAQCPRRGGLVDAGLAGSVSIRHNDVIPVLQWNILLHAFPSGDFVIIEPDRL